MPLIKHRPRIAVTIPRTIHPGMTIRVGVQLDAKKVVPVDFVQLWLRGTEFVGIGAGKTRSTRTLELISLLAKLPVPKELPEGRTELAATFVLPANLPPTLHTSNARSSYELDLHVSIPWWPDARKTFALPVTLPPCEKEEQPKRVHTTRVGGPISKEPHLEFSLDNSLLIPGDKLAGQFALFNVAHNRYREARISLVATVMRRLSIGHPWRSEEAKRYNVRLQLESTKDGQSIPFGMQLPEDLEPASSSHLWSFYWQFEIALKIAWGSDLSAACNVEVLPRASRRRSGDTRAIQVGTQRVNRIWQRVAEEHGYSLGQELLSAQFGEVRARIRVDRSGDHVSLRAELRYPDMGVSLDGGLRTGLKRVFQDGVEMDGGSWDRKHYLTSREPAQAEAFKRPIAALLVSSTLEDIDDETLVLSRRGGGQSYKHLADFAALVKQLAVGLKRARKALPAPQLMGAALMQWQRIAKSLQAPLGRGDMSVRGQFDGRVAQLRTAWSSDNKPLYTEVLLHSQNPIAEQHRLVWSDKLIEGDPAAMSAAAKRLFTDITSSAQSLTIAEDRIVAWQPAPAMRSELALGWLTQLDALERALHGQRGPYR